MKLMDDILHFGYTLCVFLRVLVVHLTRHLRTVQYCITAASRELLYTIPGWVLVCTPMGQASIRGFQFLRFRCAYSSLRARGDNHNYLPTYL